jgi:hypothetical protein
MKKWITVSFAGLLLLGACKNASDKKVSNEEVIKQAAAMKGANAGSGKFDIDIPTGWQRIDTSLSGLKATFVMAPEISENFRANANIITQSMNGYSAEKYFNENVSVMSRSMQQFNTIEKGEKEIGGSHAYWIHYSALNSGMMLEQLLTVVPDNGVAYLITCTSLKGRMEKDKAGYDQIINSFRIH